MTNTSFPIRPITAEEWPAALETIALAFLEPFSEADAAVVKDTIELDRTLVAFDGKLPVATAGAHTMQLTAPGGFVPAAGVTIVTVHPAYRRRGLLSALMDRQLGDLAEHGEAVSILWASESSIYGRFGYTVAAHHAHVDVDRAAAALTPATPANDELRVELARPTDALPRLQALYEELRPTRPGYVSRNDAHWADALHESERDKSGPPLQALLVSAAGELRGYALYKVTTGDHPRVRFFELQAKDAAAYAACWRYLTTLDLTTGATGQQLPVDAPLFQLLANPRNANVSVTDGLWARLVRVGEALAGRRYAAPVDLVLDVVDERCPHNAGRWRLSGDESGASCERTTDPADVRVDTRVLAAAYLGDGRVAAQAAAGLAEEHSTGALRRLSTAMSWDPRPWCCHSF